MFGRGPGRCSGRALDFLAVPAASRAGYQRRGEQQPGGKPGGQPPATASAIWGSGCGRRATTPHSTPPQRALLLVLAGTLSLRGPDARRQFDVEPRQHRHQGQGEEPACSSPVIAHPITSTTKRMRTAISVLPPMAAVPQKARTVSQAPPNSAPQCAHAQDPKATCRSPGPTRAELSSV